MSQLNNKTKLDEVLKYLTTIQQPNSFREFYDMKKELAKRGLQYDEFDLWIIMDKLCNDGYVSTEEKYVNNVSQNIQGEFKESKRLNHRFYITYDGRMFISKRFGGYKWKMRKELAKTLFMLITTSLLTIGTLGLLVWEIFKASHHCH
jgi:hypothetical protein